MVSITISTEKFTQRHPLLLLLMYMILKDLNVLGLYIWSWLLILELQEYEGWLWKINVKIFLKSIQFSF